MRAALTLGALLAGGALTWGHALAAGAAVGDAPAYRLEKVVPLPGGDTGWDYNALDARRGRMFIAHRKAGLQVYDTRAGRLLATLRDSQDANTSALAPEFDLGVAGTTDGDLVVFRLSTLQTLVRRASGTGGFDGATFDPVSQRFALVGEADETTGTTPLLFLDGKTAQPLGRLPLASAKVDAPASDGQGHLYLPLRDKNLVAKVDARTMTLLATLPLQGCATPCALGLDAAGQRLFVGCRGDATQRPALAVLDMHSGAQVALLPIGRGVDDVFYHARSRRVISVNGEDASLTVIRQNTADDYTLEQTVGTRPMARTGVLDDASGKLFLVNAQYVQQHTPGQPPQTRFLPNTFSVLTYAPGARP